MSDPNRRDESEPGESTDEGVESPDVGPDESAGADPGESTRTGSGDASGAGSRESIETDPERDPLDESDRVANEERRRNTTVVSGIVAVVGAWVAISPFVYDAGQATLWNNVVVGAAVVVAGGYNYYRQYRDVPLSVAVATLIALLGIWLVVAPALLGMATGAFWSTIVSGLLIAGLAGYNAYEAREARTAATDADVGAP